VIAWAVGMMGDASTSCAYLTTCSKWTMVESKVLRVHLGRLTALHAMSKER